MLIEAFIWEGEEVEAWAFPLDHKVLAFHQGEVAMRPDAKDIPFFWWEPIVMIHVQLRRPRNIEVKLDRCDEMLAWQCQHVGDPTLGGADVWPG